MEKLKFYNEESPHHRHNSAHMPLIPKRKCAELTPRSCVRIVRGEGGLNMHAHTHQTQQAFQQTHTHTYKHTHTHTSPPVLMQVLPSSSHCFVLLALVICVFKFSYIFSHLRPCCILIFYRLFVFRGLMLLSTLVSSMGASMQHTAKETSVVFVLCCRRMLFVTYSAISCAHEILYLSIGKNGS